MKDNWKDQYKEAGYLSKHPNDFFAQFIDTIPARKLLLPNAGDGRNAVYAAQYGWGVDAFDQEEENKKKALQLADEKFVSINYETADLLSFSGDEDNYDLIALLDAQFPDDKREIFHRKLVKYLKKGGRLILEAFAKDQPQNSLVPWEDEVLYNIPSIQKDFMNLRTDMLKEKTIEIKKGYPFKLIHFVGIKE